MGDLPERFGDPIKVHMWRDNLDENGGGNQSAKRQPVAK
jgi:hypothetical protein